MGTAGLTQLAEEQGNTAAADGQRVGEWGLDDLPVTSPQRDGSLWKERDQRSAAPASPASAQSSVSRGELAKAGLLTGGNGHSWPAGPRSTAEETQGL